MFSNCLSLTSIYLSNFDTSYVYNMKNMFLNCTSLTSIDLSNFNITGVRYMNLMFYHCPSLRYIDISSFYTKLDEIDLLDFEAQNGTLKINKEFLEKLKVKPPEDWTIITDN